MNTINVSWAEWFSALNHVMVCISIIKLFFIDIFVVSVGLKGVLIKTPFSVECLQTMIFILLKEVTSPKKVLSNQVANWI